MHTDMCIMTLLDKKDTRCSCAYRFPNTDQQVQAKTRAVEQLVRTALTDDQKTLLSAVLDHR